MVCSLGMPRRAGQEHQNGVKNLRRGVFSASPLAALLTGRLAAVSWGEGQRPFHRFNQKGLQKRRTACCLGPAARPPASGLGGGDTHTYTGAFPGFRELSERRANASGQPGERHRACLAPAGLPLPAGPRRAGQGQGRAGRQPPRRPRRCHGNPRAGRPRPNGCAGSAGGPEAGREEAGRDR